MNCLKFNPSVPFSGTAFGETLASGTRTVNLRFPGQYYDQETGLHYNWNRYYDPRIGRYVTSDPIGLNGGLNTYAYVENNPVNWFDPDGLKRVLRQITEIFNLTIDEFGSGRDKPRQVRDRTIKYYTNVPDCFVLKSTEHFAYNNNVVLDTSKQLIPFLGAPTLTGQRVNITFYRYGPPSSGGCCKGTETPGGIEELLGRPELAEFLWKTLYSFIDSIGKDE